MWIFLAYQLVITITITVNGIELVAPCKINYSTPSVAKKDLITAWATNITGA